MSDISMDVDPEGGVKSFEPVPAGEYVLAITDKTPGTTQSGRKKLDLELTVNEGPFVGRKLWYTLTFIAMGEEGHGFTIQCLRAFGLMAKGDTKVDLSYGDFTGRTARAKVIIEEYQGKRRNKVAPAGWITGDEADVSVERKPQPAAKTPAPVGGKSRF